MNLLVIRPFVFDGKQMQMGDVLVGLPAHRTSQLLADAPQFVKVQMPKEERTFEEPPQDRMVRKPRKRSVAK